MSSSRAWRKPPDVRIQGIPTFRQEEGTLRCSQRNLVANRPITQRPSVQIQPPTAGSSTHETLTPVSSNFWFQNRSGRVQHVRRPATMKESVFTRICTDPCVDAGAEKIGGIGSEGDRAPDVTRHHGQEGADARRDRITHSAPARLW